MSNLNTYIEHSVLGPDTTIAKVKRICEEAIQHQFAGVCVPPLYVREARRIIGEDSKIKVATVVAFPMGYSAIAAKSEEIKRALEDGADEIDGVINLAALKSGNWNHVEHDIEGMALATNMRGKSLKLIIEMGFLTEEDIKTLCDIAIKSKVRFLKTGTGMHGFDATPEMVNLLKKHSDSSIKIKASGGIRTKELALALIEAGASRLGTSHGMDLI